MFKKKEISVKWVVIDTDNQSHNYPSFVDALKHPGRRVCIMTEEYYNTTYKEIIRKL
jgi:hypothetical protein